MPFYKWNIAFSPLVQFACPTLEDARAIAEEAWTGLCWNEEGLDWRSGDQRVCETFWVFSVIGARFFSMSQSCKTERETCGKDCVSAVYALSLNRIYIYIYIFSCNHTFGDTSSCLEVTGHTMWLNSRECNHTFVCEYIMTYFPSLFPAFWWFLCVGLIKWSCRSCGKVLTWLLDLHSIYIV